MTRTNVRNPGSEPGRIRSLIERNPLKALALLLVTVFILTDLLLGWFLIPRQADNPFRAPHYYYHHGLLPNVTAVDRWGVSREYPFYTNSLGLRDGAARNIPLTSGNRRVMLLGDSFVEGQGVAFEDSFAGILNKKLASQGIEILNASVVSYSPRLYYLKTRYLIEEAGLKFQELIVFIDISDIQNEIVYQYFDPEKIQQLSMLRYRLLKYLKKTSYIYYAADKIAGRNKPPDFGNSIFDNPFNHFGADDTEVVNNTYSPDYLASWTYDTRQFGLYGKKGLQLAGKNMRALADLCLSHGIRLSIAVYPWPQQITLREYDSLQTEVWRKFSEETGATFINLFPLFVNNNGAQDVINKYFIPGDVHWNEAGHSLVASALIAHLSPQQPPEAKP